MILGLREAAHVKQYTTWNDTISFSVAPAYPNRHREENLEASSGGDLREQTSAVHAGNVE